MICQHALDPGLTLCARITDKSYVNLAKQKSCSFNILMSLLDSWSAFITAVNASGIGPSADVLIAQMLDEACT